MFDSGGLNIKLNDFSDMKEDMTGSAIVFGLIKLLALNKVKGEFIGLIPIVENSVAENRIIENFGVGENEVRLVENGAIENIDVASLRIIKNDSNLITRDPIKDEHIQVAIVERVFNNIYYGTLTWAEEQITRGTRVSDKIGLTDGLTKSVEKSFNNIFNY